MEKTFKNAIAELNTVLNTAFYNRNTPFSAIRLAFLKYAVDNCIAAESRADMEHYMKVQKMLAARDISLGASVLEPVFVLMDTHYQLNGILVHSLAEYEKELFGMDESWNKKNTSDKQIEDIMRTLARFDFAEGDGVKKGKILADALLSNLYNNSEGNKLAFTYITRYDVASLAAHILSVSENDTFLDFVSGTGFSTSVIAGDSGCQTLMQDINEETLAIAAMLFIMSGNPFSVTRADTLDNESELPKASKIFADPPLSIKFFNHPLKESALIALEKAVNALEENGTAVVLVNASLISSTAPKIAMFREKLVGNMWVEAVIALPVTWPGTNVSVNLLVLSKKENREIVFVNCCGEEFKAIVPKVDGKGAYSGLNDMINSYISAIVSGKELVAGISAVVDIKAVYNNGYSLKPNVYVKDTWTEEDTTIEEIDAELKRLYTMLYDSIDYL